jgi:pimeloyl-ACP methyl ester carboxylesterase
MTYSAYNRSARDSEDYSKERGLDRRMQESGKPLLVIMGAEEQIIDEPPARLAEYRKTYPGTRTKLIQGAGHSPNVEKPAETAALVLGFDRTANGGKANRGAKSRVAARSGVQDRVQKRKAVRGRS